MTRKTLRLALNLMTLAILVSSSWIGYIAGPQSAAAAGCQPPSIGFGRWKWCGYFFNRFQSNGGPVRAAGVPNSVQDVNSFINMIEGDLTSGNTQRIIGAKFVIRLMDGQPLPNPPDPFAFSGPPYTLSDPIVLDWEQRVLNYGNLSENGNTSLGSSGSISWHVSQIIPCNVINTYYQPAEFDVAPYIELPSNSNCGTAASTSEFIYFRSTSGAVQFEIRRPCMNPIGTMGALSPPPPQYNLSPDIQMTSNGNPLPNNSFVQPGDQVSFAYTVKNSAGGTANGISCQAHGNNYAGYNTTPPTGGTPAGVTCTGTFPPGTTSLGTENIASAPNDTSLCRSLMVNPSAPSGGSSSVVRCVFVASSPYFRVYGGDISAGNPQASSCATVKAGIVAWNQAGSPNYAGASSQYAAMALDAIYDFATSVGNGAGAAAAPSGLAFANTTASGPHMFGGNFGNCLSVPPVTDYYSQATGGALPNTDLGNAADVTGAYSVSGPYTITGGTLTTAKRIVLYVNGDVIIKSNITYPATWNSGNVPLVEIVVSGGSILIDKGVTRLDGLYVAQATGVVNSGTIYTCTNANVPYNPGSIVNGTFNGPCNSKLIVNGAFVANQVQLLRTNGTLKQSTTGETAAAGAQAEVFYYSPALWMALPSNTPTVGEYDSITSLPPIL